MKKIIITVVVLVLAVAFIGMIGVRRRRVRNMTVEKKVEVVRRGDFQSRIEATGNLEALVSVEVKSNVEGEIQKLYVKEGDYVQKDQVLLEINPKQVTEDKKQAKANVDAAQAQLTQAELGIKLKTEELNSALQQAKDNVKIAEANQKTTIASSQTQMTQAETEIQTTKNSWAQDKIALEQAGISLNQAKLTLSELETGRDSAKVALDNANSELQRNKDLFEKKLVSKKSLEDAEARQANAESQYDSSLKRVESQKKTVQSQDKTIETRQSAIATREAILKSQELNLEQLREMRQSQEKQAMLQLQISQTRLDQSSRTINNEKLVTEQSKVSAEAGLLRNQSSLKNQEERLGWTTIKAPVSGTVTLMKLEEGEIVTSGRSAFSQSPPLMTIDDLSQMVVKTYINEVDMERLRLNQEAEIKVDAYSKKVYKGRVYKVSPSGAQKDNIISFEVMVEVVGSPSELRPGMSADVDIITYEEKNVLMLPLDAIEEVTSVIATAQVSDTGGFKENQPIELKAVTGKTFTGNLTSIRGGELAISLDSSQRGVRPGQQTFALLVNGQQKLDGVSTMVKISKEKFVTLDTGNGSENGKNAPKGKGIPVETGMQNATDTIIKSGVAEGDRVILPVKPSSGPVGPVGGRRG